MAKKGSLPMIYLIGMVLVVVGMFCPMFAGKFIFSWEHSGFSLIDFDDFGIGTIAGLLILIGGILGIVACFMGGKNSDLLKLVAVLLVAVGVVIIIVNGFTNTGFKKFDKWANKNFFKSMSYGFYMIVGGDILALVGKFMK